MLQTTALHRAGRAMKDLDVMLKSAMNTIPPVVYAIPLLVLLVLFLTRATIKILREYERGVVFKLGRFQGTKGPGLVILIPFF